MKEYILNFMSEAKSLSANIILVTLALLIHVAGVSDPFFILINNIEFLIIIITPIAYLTIDKDGEYSKPKEGDIIDESIGGMFSRFIGHSFIDLTLTFIMYCTIKLFMCNMVIPEVDLVTLEKNVEFSIEQDSVRGGKSKRYICRFNSLNSNNLKGGYSLITSLPSCFFASQDVNYDVIIKSSRFGVHKKIYLCNKEDCYMAKDNYDHELLIKQQL